MAQLCTEARRSRHGAGHGTQGRAGGCVSGTAHVVQQHSTLRHVAIRYSIMQHYLQHSTLQRRAARCHAAARPRPVGVACATAPMHGTRARALPGACVCARVCALPCARAWEVLESGAVRRSGSTGAASGVLRHATPTRCVATRWTRCTAATRCTALQPLHARCSGCSAPINRLQDCVRICYFRQRQVPAATGGAYRPGVTQQPLR